MRHPAARRTSIATAAVLALALAPAVPAVSATSATASAATSASATADASAAATGGKGPVGWDVYRHLDRLPVVPRGVSTRQFSSFDRAGGNGDFSRCLRTTADGCVIAEHSGAGEIDSIWFTRDGGDVRNTKNITIQLDGRTVVHAPLQDVVDGKVGAPFAFPLVANADQTSGGVYIKVPMPFRSSMRIITDTDPIYYHVTYRAFADAAGVTTFDPAADKAEDVIAMLKAAGTRDPKPAQPGARTDSRSFSLAAGGTTTLAGTSGPGLVTALRLRLPQLVGAVQHMVTDDGRAFGAGGSSEFTVRLDPNNTGVRLTRRLDPNIRNQQAQILVDGVHVADWTAGPPGTFGTWADQSAELPAAATAGKSQITVRNVFSSSDLDYSEFTYWADSHVAGALKRTDTVDLGENHPAEEAAHAYKIVNQTWQGVRTFSYPPTPEEERQVADSDAVLQKARLRISFDGNRTVDAPLGEFFGSGLGEYQVRALMSGIDTDTDWLSAWWPMPYRQRVDVTLVNGSGVPIKDAQAQITTAPVSGWAGELSAGGDAGYFRVTTRSAATTQGEDYTFLSATGRGKFVGVTHTMRGPGSRGYLEGDERVYVDGSRSPQLHGTGTEDFYEGGWYFNRDTFSDPMNGEPGHEPGTFGCPADHDCTGVYRQMVADAVPFGSSLEFGIEHGGVDDVPADYASTALWYGRPDGTLRWTDQVDVGDAASEQAHGYTATGTGAGTPTTLTNTYEGNDGPAQPVTDDLRATTAPVTFRVAVDSANRGVVLRRLSDQAQAGRQAAVTVNGRPAGTWAQPLGNPAHRWLDDAFEVPAALTAGQDALTITLTPASGAPAWTAARYAAISEVPTYSDRTAPGAVGTPAATGGASNVITLAWKPARDDVYAPAYEVYASRSAGFTPGSSTRVGTTALPSFAHTGLGLRETWHYRVRAVDAAGHAGPYSAEVAAATGDTFRVEAEGLLPAESATAPALTQGDCCGVSWSGHAQLWFQAAKAGDAVTVAFDLPKAGTYAVTSAMTKAGDYGIARLALDGAQIGAPLDGYNNGVTVTPPIDDGTHQLAAGRHTLTLTVTGKNAASTGFFAGLDYIAFQLTG